MTILVCFAVKQESQFFHPAAGISHSVIACITGMGKSNAERSVQAAFEKDTPDLVLSCGFAGGLNPSLKPGSILFDADEGTDLKNALLDLKAMPARFHCATRIASTAAEKEKLWRLTNAEAVEMESVFIREICRQRAIPSATVRVILDAANEDLPLDFNGLMNRKCEIDYAKVIGRVLASPGKILSLVAFQRQSILAAQKLGDFLGTLLQRELL
jgi:adenosylhomocysteine nucleosidase